VSFNAFPSKGRQRYPNHHKFHIRMPRLYCFRINYCISLRSQNRSFDGEPFCVSNVIYQCLRYQPSSFPDSPPSSSLSSLGIWRMRSVLQSVSDIQDRPPFIQKPALRPAHSLTLFRRLDTAQHGARRLQLLPTYNEETGTKVRNWPALQFTHPSSLTSIHA
jgi:hypothetical protein